MRRAALKQLRRYDLALVAVRDLWVHAQALLPMLVRVCADFRHRPILLNLLLLNLNLLRRCQALICVFAFVSTVLFGAHVLRVAQLSVLLRLLLS